MKFNDLKLKKEVLIAIDNLGYKETTPIQELAIPIVIEGKDIIGLAQTGTGKTAAFALPIINNLIKKDNDINKIIKALIISPTRELAIQIRDNINSYSTESTLKCGVVLGGVNQNSQIKVLKKGVDILVATPGRLVDLIKQKYVDISKVEYLVLDEADTMLDMGFIRDVRFIISKIDSAHQTMLFSATFPNEVKTLANELLKNPITVKPETNEITANNIDQEVYYVDSNNKINILLEILANKDTPSTLIFTRTKHGANKLATKLEEYNLKSSVIHGNKTQSNRVKALKDFKDGKTKIMIATDIAARGIDINDLNIVVNYEIPEKNEMYVHRIGRTARAGKKGKAISLCSSAEMFNFKSIEKLIGNKIKVIDHKYPMVLKETKPSQKKFNNQPKKHNNSTKNNSTNQNKSYKKNYKKKRQY